MTAILSVAVPADARSMLGGHGHARTHRIPELRTPPPLEPRFDDEAPPDANRGAAELLPFDTDPWPPRSDRAVDLFDPQPTSRRCLPDPGPWAAHFVQAALEILTGRRPVGQLQRWASLPAINGVKSAARPVSGQTTPANTARPRRPARPTRQTRPVGPARPAGPVGPTAPAQSLHSVHVSEPANGVAEVCAVVRQGERYRALAARLEGLDGRWQCVSFRLL